MEEDANRPSGLLLRGRRGITHNYKQHPAATARTDAVTQTGLKNGGNTCYQNAMFTVLSNSVLRPGAIQFALFRPPPITTAGAQPQIDAAAIDQAMGGITDIGKALLHMFRNMSTAQVDAAYTRLREFWKWTDSQAQFVEFRRGLQQDPSEFLSLLLSKQFGYVPNTDDSFFRLSANHEQTRPSFSMGFPPANVREMS